LHSPKLTGRPCWSRSVPVLLRNSLVAPVLQVRRMCCWMDCSDAMPLSQSSLVYTFRPAALIATLLR
jgi:hypothetical protein